MKVTIERVGRCYACMHTVREVKYASVTGQVSKSTHTSAPLPQELLERGCVFVSKLVLASAHLRLREWISTS